MGKPMHDDVVEIGFVIVIRFDIGKRLAGFTSTVDVNDSNVFYTLWKGLRCLI